uniref:BHLH domain-containing protein n=1 Tax=Trichobilharzia regenti TaxID=157069 RepID=A0AA85JTB9_TRIRE|nr:unnamed protein product [Trichobilharzia regenti]
MNYTQPAAILTSDPVISKNLYSSMIMNNSSNVNMTVSNMKKTEPRLCDTVKLIEHLTEENNNNNDNSNQPVDKAKKQRYREHQRRQRASLQYRNAHAARERQRVAEFNKAFKKLHSLLPTSVNTTNNNNNNNNQSGRRLSKLQILRLCSSYICYLTWILYGDYCSSSYV